MTKSQNGYPVLGSHQTRRWDIPDTGRGFTLAPGAPGFVLAVIALWFHEKVERLDGGVWDEWGHAVRPIRGSTTVASNHASGTAIDVNATRHPLGVPIAATFTPAQVRAIRARMRYTGGVVRWGGDWSRPDGMHFEINAPRVAVRAYARLLRLTKRGRRVRRLNPAR